jgi:hypothetical protein
MLLKTTKNIANNCTDINIYLVHNCSLCDEHKIKKSMHINTALWALKYHGSCLDFPDTYNNATAASANTLITQLLVSEQNTSPFWHEIFEINDTIHCQMLNVIPTTCFYELIIENSNFSACHVSPSWWAVWNSIITSTDCQIFLLVSLGSSGFEYSTEKNLKRGKS